MNDVNQTEQWACGYCIEFSDGGPCEGQLLHRGTKESCEEVANAIPAVAYSGDRPNPRAHVVICPESAWAEGTT